MMSDSEQGSPEPMDGQARASGGIHPRISELLPEITAWRHALHQEPELDFAVEKTAGFVAERLREFGCDEVVEGIGRTGVVGLIVGKGLASSGDTASRTIGLRSDMDALPIREATDLDYASNIHGRMHACGHDGHMAMLLGATRVLCETRDFSGRIAVIFQPAEETSGGGREMVEDGLMERFAIEEVYGMHNFPGIALGTFALRPGPIMAGVDTFDIELTGRGGHAAMPHLCVDTNLAAAHLVINLQSIAARRVDPVTPVVVSITTINSEGDAYNVLPQIVVRLRGTVRALEENTREQARELVAEICSGTAATFGIEARLDYQVGYPVTVNAEQPAQFAGEVAAGVAGNEHVDTEVVPSMGAEDFSYMLNARPGAFIFIGNGDSAALHHPAYDFNDANLEPGCSYWITLARQALPA